VEISARTKNIIEWGYCVIIAIVLALLVRYYIGTPTVVRQPSMRTTLEPGDRLILSRWTRTVNGDYDRGDVITFEAPTVARIDAYNVDLENPVAIYEYNPTAFGEKLSYYVLELGKVSYIKRVIGLPRRPCKNRG